jgi:hypothetical protein
MPATRRSRGYSRKATRKNKRKVSRRGRKYRGGAGPYALNLTIGQPVQNPPRVLSTAQKAQAAAVGNITLVGTAPAEITSFNSVAKSASISFNTPTPVNKIEAVVKRRDGTSATVNIPISTSGTGIRAQVTGNSVRIVNVSNGPSSLNVLGGDPGTFTLNIMTT